MIDTNSPFYPYTRVQGNYYDLSETTALPRKICDYLIDAPQGDYTPADNNANPRCRLWKYLYYDGAHPLDQTLPTITQKMSVVFNPEAPETPPTDKGYRLIPQIFTKQEQTDAQTKIYCYLGRTIPSRDEMKVNIAVTFFIWTHYTYEANTKAQEYSRVFAIEQALIEAFHGGNMAGIGTFYFSPSKHPDCGSRVFTDGNTNIGRELTVALEVATTATPTMSDTVNMPWLDNTGTVRLA